MYAASSTTPQYAAFLTPLSAIAYADLLRGLCKLCVVQAALKALPPAPIFPQLCRQTPFEALQFWLASAAALKVVNFGNVWRQPRPR